MIDEKTKLAVIDGETLMDMKLPPTKFCVDKAALAQRRYLSAAWAERSRTV